MLSSKTEHVSLKRQLEYKQAKEECIITLDILEDFECIYYNLLSCFECIDCNGKLKNKERVVEKFNAALELSIECITNKIIVKRLKSIFRIQNRLFYFYDIAKNVLKNLKKKQIALFWQIHKK